MKQFYKEYIYWEDYINGMYDLHKKEDEDYLVSNAIKLLTRKDLFLDTCKNVVLNWKISSMVNLTNKQCNRKAWLGQASCSFKYKVPESCTRIAWGKLSLIDKVEANKIAQSVINSFELNYERKDIKLYT